MPKKSIFLRACCLCPALFFYCICNCYAVNLSSAEKEYLRTKTALVFVSQTHYPPFEFTDAGQQHEGMMLDVVRWMAMELGFQPIFIDMPFQQAQEAVLSGKADIITSLFFSETRKERFEFTDPLFDVPASIFIRPERTDITNIEDLKGKRIAIQRGDYAQDFLKSQKITFKTIDTQDFAEAIDRVDTGKADAVIGDEQIVLYSLFSNRLTDRIKRIGQPLYIGKTCMASNKNNALLIGILDKGIQEARKTGVLDKIGKKWLGTTYGRQESFFERHVWLFSATAGGVLLFSLGVWVWNVRLRTSVQKKTKALLESEEKYRKIFENQMLAICIWDIETCNFVDINETFIQLYGYSREESKDLTIHDLLAESKTQQEAFRQTDFKEKPFIPLISHKKKNGVIFPVEIVRGTCLLKGRQVMYSLIQDITKRKQTEDALQRSRERLELALKANPVAIWDWDLPTNEFYYSSRWWHIVGYKVNELPADSSLWHRLMHPEDLQHAHSVVSNAIAEKRTYELETRLLHKQGHYVSILTRGFILRDENGRAVRVSGTDTDLSDRKRVAEENRQWERQLQQLQKTESLHRMAGAIAHHFNNLLGVVTGNLEIALEILPAKGGPVPFLQAATQAADRAVKVSSLMLTYLGHSISKHESLDFSEICRTVLPSLENSIPTNIHLQSDFPTPGPVISANADQIRQMLKNLIDNASEAIEDNLGRINLTLSTVSRTDIAFPHRFPLDWTPQEEQFACLEVRDSGCGIADQDIEKLFDPFFSNKFTGRGLGLSVVLGILRSHHGGVTVASEPGRGSVFRIYFPLSVLEAHKKTDLELAKKG